MQGGLLKEDDPGNSWILYGIADDGTEVILSSMEKQPCTADDGSIMCYIDNPQPFSSYKFAFYDTSKMSGAAGAKDKDEWSLGEMKLYTNK